MLTLIVIVLIAVIIGVILGFYAGKFWFSRSEAERFLDENPQATYAEIVGKLRPDMTKKERNKVILEMGKKPNDLFDEYYEVYGEYGE